MAIKFTPTYATKHIFFFLPPAVTVGKAGQGCLINHDPGREGLKNANKKRKKRSWNVFVLRPTLSCWGVRELSRVDYIYCHLFPSVDCFAYFFGEPPLFLLSLPYVRTSTWNGQASGDDVKARDGPQRVMAASSSRQAENPEKETHTHTHTYITLYT